MCDASVGLWVHELCNLCNHDRRIAPSTAPPTKEVIAHTAAAWSLEGMIRGKGNGRQCAKLRRIF